MIGHAWRCRSYRIQNGQDLNNYKPTPAQKRRARRKLGHTLAKKGNTAVRTVKGRG